MHGGEWLALRADFVAARGWASRDEALARLADFDEAVRHAGDAEEVVLWFEHDLHCQLMLVRTLAHLARAAPRRLSLVGTGYFLSGGDVAALFPERQPVEWTFFSASGPSGSSLPATAWAICAG